MRKIKKYAMKENQEWLVETSYTAKNRLRGAAVENKQAAIRGLPKVEEEDAMEIMKVIMATRGISRKNSLTDGEKATS